MLKQCTKCGETKAFEFFYKAQTNKDGLTYRCIACKKEDRKISYKKHKLTRLEDGYKYLNALPKGVYRTVFKQGDYIGEGRIKLRLQAHRGGYSNVNDGSLTFIRLEVLEYIQDEVKRKEREKYWIKKLNPSLNTLLLS